jgi:adenylate kinase
MKKVIIFIAPPGAGKGTQANLLAEYFDLVHLETSKVIEKRIMNAKEDEYLEVDGEKFLFSEEKRKWESGEICSPTFVTQLVLEEIERLANEEKGIVFSGSPRSIYEAQKEAPLLEKLYGRENVVVLKINLSPEESIFRNSHRRICSLMRHPILWLKETENLSLCPLDGSKLIKRESLDDPETIKVRLKEFQEKTAPVIDYLKEKGFRIEEINGEQTVEEVFQEIIKKLNF